MSDLSQVSNDWLVVLQGEVNLSLEEGILQQGVYVIMVVIK